MDRADPNTSLQYGPDRGVARVILDSPHNRNALSAALMSELELRLSDARADDGVRVVELTHTGGTFCAGADLSESRHGVHRPPVIALLRQIVELPKPVVASLDGHVRAGGMGLVGACGIALVGPTKAVLDALRKASPQGLRETKPLITRSVTFDDGDALAAIGAVVRLGRGPRGDDVVPREAPATVGFVNLREPQLDRSRATRLRRLNLPWITSPSWAGRDRRRRYRARGGRPGRRRAPLPDPQSPVHPRAGPHGQIAAEVVVYRSRMLSR